MQTDSNAISSWRAFIGTFKRDLLLVFRRRSDIVNPLLFFTIAVTLFPLGISPDAVFLAQIAAGVLWVAALLATLLSLDSLFQQDMADGSLEQLVISPHPLAVLVLSKVLVHWLVTGLPLTLLAPLLAVMMFLPDAGFGTLFISLLLGTPTLSLIGAIGAALTVGLRRTGVLMTLLILPLYIPVLIFGTGAVISASQGMAVTGHLAILGALFLVALVSAPLAAGAALKISLNG
ncbi:heme exporter protein CcmB [Oceanospirillum multiglobuliferum]|uniref:Heme exporter protein B n=2 Tax=Oceanospirillum multiglobuliferum TaxID=64969 RepID=A0A1V4T8B1_9GAMM|nr:heme exporter protein CcmB [Oceanospirillum multiglobuliferum]OPX56855.1 heme exporter protein CcmB [Oceanospirillum multiglobuliferum]